MRRIIAILLSFAMLFSLSACGAGGEGETTAVPESSLHAMTDNHESTESPAETATLITYPLNTDRTYARLAVELPDHIYTTAGSENGLGGTIFSFSGSVTDYFTTDTGDFVFESIVVNTGDGEVVVSNYYKAIYNATLLEYGIELTKTVYPYDVNNFVFPNIGESASFIGVYMGYSEAEKSPVFVLGANPAIFNMLDYEDPAKQQESTLATETNEPTTTENEYKATTGELNALNSAKSYLRFSSFSYNGLIDQLEYEGYTTEEATYAADNCGADWYEQALISAKNYLDFSAFSYSGLIDQLEYEEFTSEEAKYAADNCGADWYEQAAKCAESYLSFSSFSREGLIDQLIYEGFTREQAIYGVDANGL